MATTPIARMAKNANPASRIPLAPSSGGAPTAARTALGLQTRERMLSQLQTELSDRTRLGVAPPEATAGDFDPFAFRAKIIIDEEDGAAAGVRCNVPRPEGRFAPRGNDLMLLRARPCAHQVEARGINLGEVEVPCGVVITHARHPTRAHRQIWQRCRAHGSRECRRTS